MAGNLIAENRRARFDYFLDDAMAAGIAQSPWTVAQLLEKVGE